MPGIDRSTTKRDSAAPMPPAPPPLGSARRYLNRGRMNPGHSAVGRYRAGRSSAPSPFGPDTACWHALRAGQRVGTSQATSIRPNLPAAVIEFARYQPAPASLRASHLIIAGPHGQQFSPSACAYPWRHPSFMTRTAANTNNDLYALTRRPAHAWRMLPVPQEVVSNGFAAPAGRSPGRWPPPFDKKAHWRSLDSP